MSSFSLSRELNHILGLAQRDLLKFVRNKGRIAGTFIFPVVFLGIFAVTLDSGLGRQGLGFSYIDYVFSGLVLQTLFQSSAMGIISLISDREQDFAMSIFVSPVSRSSIILGKILGESLVSLLQVSGIILFGYFLGVSFSPLLIPAILGLGFIASLVGGSFGIFIASRINEAENAQRVFPFLMFPLIFLSGAFTPVNNLPPLLTVLRSLNPIYYGVDLMRNVLYMGRPEYEFVVGHSWWYDATIFLGLGLAFFVVGSYLFTHKEGNK